MADFQSLKLWKHKNSDFSSLETVNKFYMALVNSKKSWLRLLIPFSLVVIINIVSNFPEYVEKYYSSGVYQYISAGLRILLGWLPFSIGDLLYLSAGLWLVVR